MTLLLDETYDVISVASSSHLVGGCIQSMIGLFSFCIENKYA